MDEVPTWERREAWGRAAAIRWLDRGLRPPPTLVLFEGDEATVYVRGASRLERSHDRRADERLAWDELFALGWTLRPEGVLLLTPVRVRTDADGALAGEAEGEAGVGMEWMRRRPDAPPEHGGVVLTYGLDDAGRVTWRDREELPGDDGPLRAPLTAVVTGRWPAEGDDVEERSADLGMSPASLAYSLRCFGLTVGVADGWLERYGFAVPLDPRDVRREDRRRAEAWRDHQRALTEVRR
ncbi:MAG: hypothetical protein KY457_02280 [Actinobacteria bacterium]|nr:hypothetical protein [Actinomycetota bacterium]